MTTEPQGEATMDIAQMTEPPSLKDAGSHCDAPSHADPSRFVNYPTEEGRALGREIARMADGEFARDPALRPRCHDCAFLAGTEPNAIAGTLMNALKCAMEREPFYCHVIPANGRERLCAGWEAMLNRGNPVQAPWDYIEGVGDPMARCIPEPQPGPQP